MTNKYINVPLFTTINKIISQNYTLSATQYKKLCIKNNNVQAVSRFLDRELTRLDLGSEVGSENYVENSEYLFIKTKALQPDSFLIDDSKDAMERISPKAFYKMNLKRGDIIISKDSNVGEIAILDKNYLNATLCGGIYRLPITNNKYYLLAFIKSELFRQQIDFMIPRGSTIKHGKTRFLDCLIPLPNKNVNNTILFVEILTKAIINKEIAIRKRYKSAMNMIQQELENNQKKATFCFSLPTIGEICNNDRIDSSLYSKSFKEKEFLITNYNYGVSTIKELGFKISRGQNLQISNIGKSVLTSEYRKGYYTLILPKFLSKYGTITSNEYLGNPNTLKTLKKGEIIFGAEGNEKGRSFVVIEERDKTITNIHGITLTQSHHDIKKGIFVKLFLDYYRLNGMIDSYAVGGNGGSLAIKYWDYLKFPNFPDDKIKKISKFYYSGSVCNYNTANLKNFEEIDNNFNKNAGIFELDKTMKYFKRKLESAINDIANDKEVKIVFN
ncbi:MAG: restriction endonuclease subunit S [Ruminococcus sp.]|nr:restriction endonuclease subunit S [Ruminococcus sp.]